MSTSAERLASEIRDGLECASVPVDLFSIARQERIEMAPGQYGSAFHGRIEYLPDDKLFILYYPDETCGVAPARVRFTIAHELGHYYLPEHRLALLTGAMPDCAVGFISDNARETEADEFAACLLVPPRYLDQVMGSKRFMDLAAIVNMASVCEVSVVAAVIRYVRYAEEKCAAVLSQEGQVKYYVSSEEMSDIGFAAMSRGRDLPASSKARELLTACSFRRCDGKLSSTREWFRPRTTNLDLWEDSYALGYSGQVITLLSVQRKARG